MQLDRDKARGPRQTDNETPVHRDPRAAMGSYTVCLPPTLRLSPARGAPRGIPFADWPRKAVLSSPAVSRPES